MFALLQLKRKIELML